MHPYITAFHHGHWYQYWSVAIASGTMGTTATYDTGSLVVTL